MFGKSKEPHASLKEKYLKSPHQCMYCDSEELDGSPLDMGAATIYQNVVCKTCGKEWTDVYTLTSVDINETE